MGEIEEIERITGPALAFAYDFVLESSFESEGAVFGDYGYCWPEEVEETHRRLFERDDPAADEVFFVPIWTLPHDLTGALLENLKLEGKEDEVDQPFSNSSLIITTH